MEGQAAALQIQLEGTVRRVDRLETQLEKIQGDLAEKAVADAERDADIRSMNMMLSQINTTTQTTNDKLLKLLEKALDTSGASADSSTKFYQKWLFISLMILASLIFAAYGIKEITKPF